VAAKTGAEILADLDAKVAGIVTRGAEKLAEVMARERVPCARWMRVEWGAMLGAIELVTDGGIVAMVHANPHSDGKSHYWSLCGDTHEGYRVLIDHEKREICGDGAGETAAQLAAEDALAEVAASILRALGR
jgi:hypothetical protein